MSTRAIVVTLGAIALIALPAAAWLPALAAARQDPAIILQQE